MKKFYTISKKKTGSNCGSYYKLFIAKFRLKLKKVGKTTRPLRYDLNQISYDCTNGRDKYIQEIRSVECLKNYGWRFVTLYRKQ